MRVWERAIFLHATRTAHSWSFSLDAMPGLRKIFSLLSNAENDRKPELENNLGNYIQEEQHHKTSCKTIWLERLCPVDVWCLRLRSKMTQQFTRYRICVVSVRRWCATLDVNPKRSLSSCELSWRTHFHDLFKKSARNLAENLQGLRSAKLLICHSLFEARRRTNKAAVLEACDGKK